MQARGEDKARVAAACARLQFPVELAEFFADLPARIAGAHLVIGRAGASTVSELAVIGRPSILVPFPACARSGSGRQRRVARRQRRSDGVPQTEFTPRAARRSCCAARSPSRRRLTTPPPPRRPRASPDAAERLAGLVLGIAAAGLSVQLTD